MRNSIDCGGRNGLLVPTLGIGGATQSNDEKLRIEEWL